MKQRLRSILVLATILSTMSWLAAVSYGQAAPGKSEKKTYTFHGKVENIDKVGKNLEVNNERIEGWMEAMTMVYPIDDPSILDKVKRGDQITATVYEGDYSLHNIKVVEKKDAAKPEPKKK